MTANIPSNTSDNRPILGLETSTDFCSVTLWNSPENYLTTSLKQAKGHSRKINDMLDDLFRLSGTKNGDLKYIVVSAGPGSFTGLRLGFTVAKAISFASSVPVAAVPTLESAAFLFSEYQVDDKGFRILSKAGSKEYFCAEFMRLNGKLICLRETELLFLDNILSETAGIQNVFISGYIQQVNNAVFFNADAAGCIRLFLSDPQKYHVTDTELLTPEYHKEFIIKKKV